MKILYNSQLINEEDIKLSWQNRGFQYGDGLFETIIVRGGKALYLKEHLNRLVLGLKKLYFSEVEKLTTEWIEKSIFQILEANQLNKSARVKLIFWRKSGGLYTPTDRGFNYLIIAKPHQLQIQIPKIKVGFCQSVRNIFHQASGFKSLSSSHYTLASLEAQERKLDELIILSASSFVSESLSSNIFWLKNGTFYTPSAKTGCVEGIRREVVRTSLRKAGYLVRRKMARKSELLQAEFVFTANVAKIQIVEQLEGTKYPNNPETEKLLQSFL